MDKNSDYQEVFRLAALRANFSACDMKMISKAPYFLPKIKGSALRPTPIKIIYTVPSTK